MSLTYVLWATLGALGVWLAAHAGRRRVPRGLAARVSLRTTEEQRPLIDRLFGSIADDLLRRRERGDVELLLKRAGVWERPDALYPHARVFYAYKIAVAAFVATLGLIFGVVFSLTAQLPVPFALGAVVIGGVLGFFLPDLDLRGKARRREDVLIADMATALDRLANFLAAGYPLPQSVNALAGRPGGVFVAELRHVAARYNVSGDLESAVDHMVERNGNLAPLIPFAGLVKTTLKMGGGVAGNLRDLAEELREELNRRITARGYRNTVLMIIPAFFAIVASLLILAAPGVLRIFNALGAGGL
jgi:Flp pilus assembly protein TadB